MVHTGCLAGFLCCWLVMLAALLQLLQKAGAGTSPYKPRTQRVQRSQGGPQLNIPSAAWSTCLSPAPLPPHLIALLAEHGPHSVFGLRPHAVSIAQPRGREAVVRNLRWRRRVWRQLCEDWSKADCCGKGPTSQEACA